VFVPPCTRPPQALNTKNRQASRTECGRCRGRTCTWSAQCDGPLWVQRDGPLWVWYSLVEWHRWWSGAVHTTHWHSCGIHTGTTCTINTGKLGRGLYGAFIHPVPMEGEPHTVPPVVSGEGVPSVLALSHFHAPSKTFRAVAHMVEVVRFGEHLTSGALALHHHPPPTLGSLATTCRAALGNCSILNRLENFRLRGIQTVPVQWELCWPHTSSSVGVVLAAHVIFSGSCVGRTQYFQW
jgi:hypothetical protein